MDCCRDFNFIMGYKMKQSWKRINRNIQNFIQKLKLSHIEYFDGLSIDSIDGLQYDREKYGGK